MLNEAMLSSDSQTWQTPETVLSPVREFFGGRIALDPCTEIGNPVGADRWFFLPGFDGLACPDWNEAAGGGGAFVNPPYGRALKEWSAKMAREGRNGCETIGLVPARTDTQWWQSITTADAVCFWKGRITFRAKHPVTGIVGPAVIWDSKSQTWKPAAAPFPSALPYWGKRPQEFRSAFQRLGWVVFSRQQELFPVSNG